MDSLATLGMPAHGYGIRYEYGAFKQKIVDGYQIELVDPWLEDGNVWEIALPEEAQFVRFGGYVKQVWRTENSFLNTKATSKLRLYLMKCRY